MTITTVDVGAAVRQWREHLDALPCGVVLARNVNVLFPQPTVHILALQDIVVCSPRQREENRPTGRDRRVILGLEAGGPLPYFSEACFCITESDLHVLSFQPWRERRRQHLYPVPTCGKCLKTSRTVTGIPIDYIRGIR